MAYTTINKPTDYFNTVTYSGNGSNNHTITGVGFNADFVWNKIRNGTDDHRLFDQVRGINKFWKSNSTAIETTDAILTTNSDGYVLTNAGEVNSGSGTYVGWNWKANGSGSSNSNGSMTATASASTVSGFSIVNYLGNGSNGASFGHGLGVKPKVVFIKNRSTAKNPVWWQDTDDDGTSNQRLVLSGTGSNLNNYHVTFGTDTITLGNTDDAWNKAGDNFIAYCFAEKTGFSKMDYYVGNGNASGPFIYTGFKPAWIINKRIDSSGNWMLIDNKRLGYNPAQRDLRPNLNNAEGNDETFDFYSNGFKVRTTSNDFGGGSGAVYIYMAFAEAPLVGSNNIPATAR